MGGTLRLYTAARYGDAGRFIGLGGLAGGRGRDAPVRKACWVIHRSVGSGGERGAAGQGFRRFGGAVVADGPTEIV